MSYIFTMNQLKEMISPKPLINLKQEETGNSASDNGGIGGFGPSLPLITSRIPGFNVNKLFEGIIELPR